MRRCTLLGVVIGLLSCAPMGSPGAVASVPAPVIEPGSAPRRTAADPTKVLTFIEENHSYAQMRAEMPYLSRLATRYAYAKRYRAITHPSLPNYLAIAAGSTFGVTDDDPPSEHPIHARTVFDQALDHGRTAKTYAEAMRHSCQLADSGTYVVRHNPWAYFRNSRARCRDFDVPLRRLLPDVRHHRLPAAGMVIPDLCHDAHDCELAVADDWLRRYLPTILAARTFTSGRLTVVITADEDDRLSHNHILTVVLNARLHRRVVSSRLDHYFLTGYYDHVLGAGLLRKAKPGFAREFRLR